MKTGFLVLFQPSLFEFPGGSDGKESAWNAGDPDSIPGSGRSLGEGNGSPLQYSCLENPMDRGAWRATVQEVAESGKSACPPLSLSQHCFLGSRSPLWGPRFCGAELNGGPEELWNETPMGEFLIQQLLPGWTWANYLTTGLLWDDKNKKRNAAQTGSWWVFSWGAMTFILSLMGSCIIQLWHGQVLFFFRQGLL